MGPFGTGEDPSEVRRGEEEEEGVPQLAGLGVVVDLGFSVGGIGAVLRVGLSPIGILLPLLLLLLLHSQTAAARPICVARSERVINVGRAFYGCHSGMAAPTPRGGGSPKEALFLLLILAQISPFSPLPHIELGVGVDVSDPSHSFGGSLGRPSFPPLESYQLPQPSFLPPFIHDRSDSITPVTGDVRRGRQADGSRDGQRREDSSRTPHRFPPIPMTFGFPVFLTLWKLN
mmetsp:Transcript_19334/g.56470  ORF Transcript_19334/g.56470 Transcript_19334/m.56470 type:complete len:231 (-) Transcript_19334:295-987(-)